MNLINNTKKLFQKYLAIMDLYIRKITYKLGLPIVRIKDLPPQSLKPFINYYFKEREIQTQIPSVLIYQMGKVGSISIEFSLKNLGITNFRCHYLSTKNLKKFKKISNNYWLDMLKLKKLERAIYSKRLKIISLVREPVGRNVSSYFQLWTDPLFRRYLIKGLEKKITLEQMMDNFIKKKKRDPHSWPLNWFDQEMKIVFGIDVYSVGFPKTKGYKIYKTKNRPDLLLIRYENLAECAKTVFKEFLGIEDFTLQKKSMAKDKPYYPLYQEFISSKMFPQDYIEEMYASKYARHFYTEEELSRFRYKWLP